MAIPDGYNTEPFAPVLGADNADNEFASTAVVGNEDGSLLERVEDLKAKQWRGLSKSLAAAALTGTATQFTVSGVVKVTKLGLHISTALPLGANTLKFQHTPTGGAATDLCGVTDTASAALNTLFLVDGVAATGLVKAATAGIALASEDSHMPLILAPGLIKSVFSAGPPATGAATIFIEYEPLTSGATIT